MRPLRLAGILIVAGFVAACADNSSTAVTDPTADLRFAKSTGGACDAAADRTIKAQQQDLFAGDYLKQAQFLWSAVESACSTTSPDAANVALIEYVRYVLSLYPVNVLIPKSGPDQETRFLGHLDSIYLYVGYAAPSLPTSNGPLDSQGALGVITQSDTQREILTADGDAALTLPIQDPSGDQRGHLFAIYPNPTGCTTDNLARIGPCYEFASFPVVSPAWDPMIQVGVCTEIPLSGTPSGNVPALGHITNGRTEIAGNLAYPEHCGTHSASAGSWTGGFGEVLKRLAWVGQKTFGVNTAYATHSGLGGIGGALSPWGGVDLLTFSAPVDVPPNVVGSFPYAPNVGTWDPSSFATPPGTILVQSSLGEYPYPMIVMSQAGGACTKKCGGLLLQGNLFSASGNGASVGKYEVSFVALEDGPSVKEAPFILRDDSNRELGRVSFATRSSQNQIIFDYNNKTGAGDVVGTWTTHVPVTFKFVVDLDAKTVSLYVNTSLVGTRSYVNSSAANLARIAFDAQGIDSGITGWDNIDARRISDH